jgi:hypothetical protein
MSYQWFYRDALDRIFVQLGQTGYALTRDRNVTARRACKLPLNYNRKSGCYVSLGLG